MEQEIQDFMKKLRLAGYAIVIFTPEECGTLHPEDVERHMAEEASILVELLSEEG